jgi:hypothetical protein
MGFQGKQRETEKTLFHIPGRTPGRAVLREKLRMTSSSERQAGISYDQFPNELEEETQMACQIHCTAQFVWWT